MRSELIGDTVGRRGLAVAVIACALGIVLPAAFAGHGFYVHSAGGYRGCGPGGYAHPAHPGFGRGGPGWGFHPHVSRRPLVGGGVFYHTRPYFSSYGRFGWPGCSGYAGYGYGGWGWNRAFPYYEPHIYVYPQAPAACYGVPESTYRRIIILNLEPGEAEVTEGADHRLPPIPDEAAFRPVQPRTIDPQQAWAYLEQGAYQDALEAFGALAAASPDEGIHKVGFGLAAALARDKITAGYALRRAFETDPEGVRNVSLSPALREKVRSLADDYDRAMQKDPENLNIRFLFAAASHLADDDAGARTCLTNAISLADNSASAMNLRKLVDLAP